MKVTAGALLGDGDPSLGCEYSVIPGCGEEVFWEDRLVRTTGNYASTLGEASWPSHSLCP